MPYMITCRDTQLLGSKWKYVINICGKGLPLLTNAEIGEEVDIPEWDVVYRWLASRDLGHTQTRGQGTAL